MRVINNYKKKLYKPFLFIIVLFATIFMVFEGEMNYKYKKYDDYSQIVELFNSNRDFFFSTANILRDNEIFYYLLNEYCESALICPPTDTTEENFFKPSDLAEINKFFDITKPYQIRPISHGLQFDYQLKSFWKTEIVSIFYFYEYESKDDIQIGVNHIKKYYNIRFLYPPNWYISDDI